MPKDSDARISEESRISSSPRKSEADSHSPYRARGSRVIGKKPHSSGFLPMIRPKSGSRRSEENMSLFKMPSDPRDASNSLEQARGPDGLYDCLTPRSYCAEGSNFTSSCVYSTQGLASVRSCSICWFPHQNPRCLTKLNVN